MVEHSKYKIFVVCFLCWIMPQLVFSQYINEAIEPSVKGEKAIDLLQGSALDTWQVPSNHWRLNQGILEGNTANVILEAPEWIYTKEQFSDFEFTCELLLTGDTRRNTGIYFRANEFLFKEKKINISYKAASGYEFDVAFDTPDKKIFTGSLADWYARPSLRVFADKNIINQVCKTEEWNRLTIRARGNRIEYWINGIKIIDFIDKDPKGSRNGKIGFQIHNGAVMQVSCRNIRVIPLDYKE